MRTAGETATGAGTEIGGAVAVALLRESLVTARLAARHASAVLAAEGFALDEWLVLDVLAQEPGTTMSQLRAATVIDKATLGRRVDRLVTRALVYREVDGLDRRVIRVHLSARGRDVHSGLTARLAQEQQAGAPSGEQHTGQHQPVGLEAR